MPHTRKASEVATGSPADVGMGLEPPKWQQPGDKVRIEVDGLGTSSDRFVKESA